ncbi:hypothetical protein THAOC_12914, partial [Thalassiosira oceanica]
MDDDTHQNPLSPRDERSEAALRALCAEAGVDYDPPSAGELDDPTLKNKRRQRLRKKCQRKRRSVEELEKDAKRKREERQEEKQRQEMKRAARELMRQPLDVQKNEYETNLRSRDITPRVLGNPRMARETVDVTQHIIDELEIGEVTVSTHSVIPFRRCGDESCEGFENLRVVAPYEDPQDETYKTIRQVGKNQKKIMHLKNDSAKYNWMEYPEGSGRQLKAIKCLHPAKWKGELKYFSSLVSVTDVSGEWLSFDWKISNDDFIKTAGNSDFVEKRVFPWKDACTATDEDEGYVICGESDFWGETGWFGIDQGLLKKFNISTRRISEIINWVVCPCKYEQLNKQFVVSAFPTHDSVHVDDRAIMPCGNSYNEVKRKHLQRHHRKEHTSFYAKDENKDKWTERGTFVGVMMELEWPPREFLDNGKSPMVRRAVHAERYLNNLVPIYKEADLICDDRHLIISPVGRISVKNSSQKSGFRENSLDEVIIPDGDGHHNATTTSLRVEDISFIENGYIHYVGEGYEKVEPSYFQVTGTGGLPVFAYGDLRGGRHVIHPPDVFATGYFSDEDELTRISNTEEDYMFCIVMQTKLGEVSVEDLQALELHINGSKRADLSESSCKSSVDESSLNLCYKWNCSDTIVRLGLMDEGCWVKLDLEIDI